MDDRIANALATVPGQMTAGELGALRRIARAVPSGGAVVEIGSLYGLSSVNWAEEIPADACLYCIDPWKREPWIIDLVESRVPGCPPFSKEAFDTFTAGHLNIIPLQGYSPQDFLDWRLPIDVVFEDSMHQNPYLRKTLEFWRRHVRKGGVICGHDYSNQWPDVKREADRIAAELGSRLQRVETFWWFHV